jgi:energy-coupling factor transporter ATP-binding protein EcfA2
MRNGGEQQRLERWGNVDARADVFRSVNGEVFPLSSGQLTFIRFAAQACLHIENGTMVLCDEPETHLHPNYISDFVRLLDKLLAETGSFAILATHSAYFVREVARSQVIVLRQTENKKVEVLTPRLRTFGADIGEISHFVFEDELFGNLVRQVRHQLKSNPSQAAKYLNSLERELSVEAWMSLSREVPRKEEK